MSKITTIYNAVKENLEDLFSEEDRLPNPYDIEANPLIGQSFYGFRVGDANSETLEHCNFSVRRTFTVVLVEKHIMTESNSEGFDNASLSLVENSHIVLKRFLNSEELDIPDDIQSLDLEGVSGIQSLKNNDESYLYMEINFNILYSESYT